MNFLGFLCYNFAPRLSTRKQVLPSPASIPQEPGKAPEEDPETIENFLLLISTDNRPFGHSEKEFASNDTLIDFVKFSTMHNHDRSSNANLAPSLSSLLYLSYGKQEAILRFDWPFGNNRKHELFPKNCLII